jgi:transposase
VIAIRDQSRAVDLAAHSDAEHGHRFVANETDNASSQHPPKLANRVHVDQTVDRLVSGHDRAEQEFRRQMVELVHAGRTPEELAHEFEPTAQSIRNWVVQWDRNAGRGDGGLTTGEREELSRLRRENRQLRLEREILSKAAAWFARETNAIPPKGSGS